LHIHLGTSISPFLPSAVNLLTAKAVKVHSEAREACQRYRATFDIARQYRREVLPLREMISVRVTFDMDRA
jgi:hypothetical protein